MTDLVVQVRQEDGSFVEVDETALLKYAAAHKMDKHVKDKAYRALPVGHEVANFLRYMTAADYSRKSYLEYESILYRFAIDHAHLEIEDFNPPKGAELIEDWLERCWPHVRPGTRLKVMSILGSFFKWAFNRDKVTGNPMVLIRRPKRKKTDRRAHSRHKVMDIVKAQPLARDRCALLLLGKLGLRKNELRLLQVKHIDLADCRIRLLQKGGDVVYHDLRFPDVQQQLAEHFLLDAREPEEFLLYPMWCRTLSDGRLVIQREARERAMSQRGMHEWWVRCLERADVPHFPMHELRHTAGTEFYRATRDMELTRQFMRHRSIMTTSEVYLHLDREDMMAAYERAALRWGETENEERQTK